MSSSAPARAWTSAASSAVRRLQLRADYRPSSLQRWVAAGRTPTPVRDGGSIDAAGRERTAA
jgi:hypothetical protein